jgi:hypothetical protein
MQCLYKSLISFLLFLVFLIGTFVWINKNKINSDQGKCNTYDSSDGSCQVSDGNTCWKGTCEGDYSQGKCTCVKNTTGARILLVLTIVLFLLSLYYLVVNFTKSKSTASMGFCSM